MKKFLLLVHLAATLFMTGVIWFVQVVHYPLFRVVGTISFPVYEVAHLRLIPWVVGPPMLIEGTTAILLLFWRPDGVRWTKPVIGVCLLLIIWLSTIVLQVPQHEILEYGYDERAWLFLVQSNWVRTGAWTARSVLALRMTGKAMK